MYVTLNTINGVAHLLSEFSLNHRAPSCTSTFTAISLIAFQNIHTRENQNISLPYTMYANTSNNTPLYTRATLSWYEEATQWKLGLIVTLIIN